MEQVSSSETSVTTDRHGVISSKMSCTLQHCNVHRQCSAGLSFVTLSQWKSCRFEVLKAVVMKRPVTPYRLAQLQTFRRRVQLPSSGQTEKSKSRGRVLILDTMNRLSERKSGPTGILVLRSGRGPIIRCDRYGMQVALRKDHTNHTASHPSKLKFSWND